MPKDRKEVDKQRLNIAVQNIAQDLGDACLVESDSGFANAVYIGERYVYKLVPLLADGTLEHPKEREVIEFLDRRLTEESRTIVPHLVHSTAVDGSGCVDVYTKLRGIAAEQFTPKMIDQLGAFLAGLHGCADHAFIHEFDGEASGPSFGDYASRSVDKFLGKLGSVVTDSALLELAQRAATRVKALTGAITEPQLVTLHKDLFRENILAESGNITGIIDWEAAQSGPREWEFAILRQRFPNESEAIQLAYGYRLDPQLIDLCGLMQSLRFWKSFPNQEDFVKQQVNYISEILKG